MARDQSGPKNPNWKGGRTVTSHGYALVRLPGHPLADVRGYVYEHRLVAQEAIGRDLQPGEEVHHRRIGIESRSVNAPDLLEITANRAAHAVLHRKRNDLRMPGETNQEIQCACGCGVMLDKFDGQGRPRKFISGHNTGGRNRARSKS